MQSSPGTPLGSHRAGFWEGPWSAFRDQSQAGAPEQGLSDLPGSRALVTVYIFTETRFVYSALDDHLHASVEDKFRAVKPEGVRVVLLLWKPFARLRVRRSASLRGSRRRGPSRDEFNVSGGASMEASTRSRRPPPFHTLV